MTAPQPDHLVWRTSSRSNGQGQCVEVAVLGTTVAVRDSKDPSGPMLVFDGAAWASFVTGMRMGEFCA